MSALFLSEREVSRVLTMELALDAVEAAHRAHGLGQAIDIPRQRTRLPASTLHILQGALPTEGISGYKAYTSSREGVRFLIHLFDAANGRLLAILQADRLGMMRTGAAGGLAARHLARPDADTLGMIGAGWQARGQLEAISRVRPLRRVRVFSRNQEKLQAFCTSMSDSLGIDVLPAVSAMMAIEGAAIVVTATTAATPVFPGEAVEPGCHINAIGSNALIRREIDETTVRRAGLICVDSRATALAEAGDLLPLLEKGRTDERQWVELGELVAGRHGGRASAEQITLFESQGLAIQDLALAIRVLARAREHGLGRQLPLDGE